MKLHLPKLLQTALMSLAFMPSPFALTVCTASSISFLSGVVLAKDVEVNLGDNDTQSSSPEGLADNDNLIVNVTGTGATWNTQITSNVTSTVTISGKASLTVELTGDAQFGVFFRGTSGSQTINLGTGATLTTKGTLAGWSWAQNNNERQGTTAINMKSGSKWNIESNVGDKCEYMTRTTITMNNATIDIGEGKFLRVERYADDQNFIRTESASAGTSVIQGDGKIHLHDYQLNFDIARADTLSEGSEAADLRIDVAITDHYSTPDGRDNGVVVDDYKHGIKKTGNGILELTNTGCNYKGKTIVEGGTLRLNNSGEGSFVLGDVGVSSSATLDISEGTTLNLSGCLNLAGTFSKNEEDGVFTYSALSNNGKIYMSEGAMIDFGVNDDCTIRVGTIENLNVSTMIHGLKGLQKATYDATAGTITFSGAIANLTWNGTADKNTWNNSETNTNWLVGQESKHFKSYDNVTFGESGEKTVKITEEIRVGTMVVNDDYTFDVQKGATIDKVQVAAGETFKAEGEGTLNVGTLTTEGGTIELHTNTHITGGGNGEGTDNRALGLSATGQYNSNAIKILGGTTTVTGATFVFQGSLTVGEANEANEAKLVTHRLAMGASPASSGNDSNNKLVVGAKGTIVVTSSNDLPGANNYNNARTGLILSVWNASTTADISGTLLARDVQLYSSFAAFTLNIKGGGTVAVKGISNGEEGKGNHITLDAGGKLVLGESGITQYRGGEWTIKLNGGEVGMSADTTTIARKSTLGGEVAFNTAKYVFDGEGADQKLTAGTVGGTMTVSGVLSGTGSVKKTGDGTLVLSGENTYSGGTTVAEGVLQVQENGNLGGGNVTISGGTLAVATTDGTSSTPVRMTALKGAGKGKMENVAFTANSLSARPASGEGASGTGKMKSLSVQFADNLGVSDLTLEDVCFMKAENAEATVTAATVTYTNAKALACLATPAGTQQQNGGVSVMAENSGNTPAATHTLTTVQTGGTAAGGLTIDLTSGFYAGNAGTTLEWTVFNGVILDSGFTLAFGDVLKSFIREGKVTLSGSLVGSENWKLTPEDVANPLSVGTGGLPGGTTDTPALLADTGTGGLITGTAGTLVLRVTNSPEPTTATLSLLALAAFAARRRRKRA